MSFRSPTPDGLTIAPNAAAFGGNPAASNQELQSHHYWGRYALTTQLPNIGFLDGVAVAGANPAAAPAYDKLAPGDFGFVEGAGPPALSNMYVCVDRGTVSGNDARWLTLGNIASTFVQTIRDAHVIVVGQDNTPFTSLSSLFAATPPPANRLNLGVAGEQLSITVDFLDTGDGAELQLALAAAAAAGVGNIDIRLRPCSIVLNAFTSIVGLVIPDRCRLIGAGMELSRIEGATGGGEDQRVVTMANRSSMEDLEIHSGQPAAVPFVGLTGVVNMAGATVRRCRISLQVSGVFDRAVTAAIVCPTSAVDMLVDDCELLVDSLAAQPADAPSYGVRVGTAGVTQLCAVDPEVRNTTIRSFGGLGSAPHAVTFENVEGGRCFNVEHIEAETGVAVPVHSFRWVWSIAGSAGIGVRGPKIHSCRTTVAASEASDQAGVLIALLGAPTIFGVSEVEVHDYTVRFSPSGPGATAKHGIRFATSVITAVDIINVTIDNCKCVFVRGEGINIDASGTAVGAIRGVRITACLARGATLAAGAGQPARGLRLRGDTTATIINLTDVGVHNCDFSNTADAGGISLQVEDIGVRNTIAIGNNLTPSAPAVALTDFGTGTEAAHNIL